MDDAPLVYRKPFVEMTSPTTEDVSACEGRSSSRLGLGGEVVQKLSIGFLCFCRKSFVAESRDVVSTFNSVVTLIDEPVGKIYQELLDYALRTRSQFSLVWRDQLEFEQSAHAIARRLRTDLVSEARTDAWPGTQLLGHLATVRTYRLSPNGLAVLRQTAGLSDWHAPSRPEDLAFYASDGRPWLGSIAHEKQAFVYPSAIDVGQLKAEVPGLKLREDLPKRTH